MNAQQQAIALFINLLAARPKRRAELMKGQFMFSAVVNGQERQVAHGEFFAVGHPPFEGVVTTMAGVACRDVEGGMLFIPFAPVAPAPAVAAVPAPAAPAPVAPPAPAPAPAAHVPVAPVPAPAVLTTRTSRVSFGELVEVWNADFSAKVEITAPSSGAVIEQLFDDGSMVVTFVGSHRQTWTI